MRSSGKDGGSGAPPPGAGAALATVFNPSKAAAETIPPSNLRRAGKLFMEVEKGIQNGLLAFEG